jgi:hypothetical protein
MRGSSNLVVCVLEKNGQGQLQPCPKHYWNSSAECAPRTQFSPLHLWAQIGDHTPLRRQVLRGRTCCGIHIVAAAAISLAFLFRATNSFMVSPRLLCRPRVQRVRASSITKLRFSNSMDVRASLVFVWANFVCICAPMFVKSCLLWTHAGLSIHRFMVAAWLVTL